MERSDGDKLRFVDTPLDGIDSRSAVNSTILDYYKKFGRKRDLEQFFSLSTAQSDIRDTTGIFWRKMKNENDSSDSGGRRSDSSSHELCRISIRCTVPPESSSQEDDPKTKSESPHTGSPPIIIEEVSGDDVRHFDDEFNKSDDNNSQKSLDALLDLSAHKPLSPTSSITSQRKLEWDSLADVGYGNESDRKTSASSLSTLERLALKQQYSNNDSKQDIGLPTSQSTPLDEKDPKSKLKKGVGKKTKIYQKGVDVFELNVPNINTNPPQSISVNLTKHISFNVEKDGGITLDNVKRDISVSPEKQAIDKAVTPYLGMDKEIQTSLCKSKELPTTSQAQYPVDSQKIPVMISLNTLRKRLRKKRARLIRKRIRNKKKTTEVEVTPQEKSGEHLSAAESFEYMPGHIYNQNQMNVNDPKPHNSTGNKSSLESSAAYTTDSSKGSKHSITKDLEKCIDVLKETLKEKFDDNDLRKRLIKEIVQRLLNSKYRDDDSATEFLSGLSYSSKRLDLGTKNNTTSSTSDANNTDDCNRKRPKKSILRVDKFNPNIVASTSQSAPNLLTATCNENEPTINTNLTKLITSNTESDSSRGKTSSENGFPKTSSEELYQKYLEALRREEAYKRHLQDKEKFLKQKLVKSDTAFNIPVQQPPKVTRRLKDLMKDLVRNNYDDGSGDASKLEGTFMHEFNNQIVRNQNHSVFTLSSSQGSNQNVKTHSQCDKESQGHGPSRQHYCCCPHHAPTSKATYVDSSCQVNLRSEEGSCNKNNDKTKGCKKPAKNSPRVISDCTGEVKYICLCNTKTCGSSNTSEKMKIYKCSRLANHAVQSDSPPQINDTSVQCVNCYTVDNLHTIGGPYMMNDESCSSDRTSNARRFYQSSQADMLIKMMYEEQGGANLCGTATRCVVGANMPRTTIINEATRSLQTEISINPRISEATFSDINIVDDCAKLCCEQTRCIPQSSDSCDVKKTFSDSQTSCGTEKLQCQACASPADFVFPIDTNMDLRVRLHDETKANDKKSKSQVTGIVGSTRRGNHATIKAEFRERLGDSNNNERAVGSKIRITQGVATERPNFADRQTCIQEECTKFAQCPCNCSMSRDKECWKEDKKCTDGGCKTKEKGPTNQKDRNVVFSSSGRRVNLYNAPNRTTRERSPPFSDNNPRRQGATQDIRRRSPTNETNARPRSPISNYPRENSPRQTSPRNRGVPETFRKNSPIEKKSRENSPDHRGSRPGSPRDRNSRATSPLERTQRDNQSARSSRAPSPSRTTSRPNSPLEKRSKPNSPREFRSTGNSPLRNSSPENSPLRNSSPENSPRNKSKTTISPRGKTSTSTSPRERSPPAKSPERKPTNSNLRQGSSLQNDPQKKPNTYPKKVTIKDKNPFRRANTELEVTCCGFATTNQNKPDFATDTGNCVGTSSHDLKESASQCGGGCRNTNKDQEKDPAAKKSEPISISSTSQSCCKSDREIQTNDAGTQVAQNDDPKGACNKLPNSECVCGNKISPISRSRTKIDKDYSSDPSPSLGSLKSNSCRKSNTNQACTNCSGSNDKNKDESRKTTKSVGCCTESNDEKQNKDENKPKDGTNQCSPPSATCVGGCSEKPSICLDNDDSTKFPTIDSGVSSKDSKDPIIDMIQGITKRYSKDDLVKIKKQKCFKEILAVLNYLLETDDSTDQDLKCPSKKSIKSMSQDVLNKMKCTCDKAMQVTASRRKCNKITTESSDFPASTDLPTTSSDSAACKVLHKIKKECEKFHQKRCKVGRRCEISSSTSANCEGCQKIHYCACKNHKCKRSKAFIDKIQKKCVAYNLIIKNSESCLEESVEETVCRPLKNIVIKVPTKVHKSCKEDCIPEKEVKCSPRRSRSRSCPNESELSSDEIAMARTVREYLEQNRPDFIEKCSKRQHCLKFIKDRRSGPSPRLRMLIVHQPKCAAAMYPIPYYKDIPMCHNQPSCNMAVRSEPNPCVSNVTVGTMSIQDQGNKVDMCYNPNPCDCCGASPCKRTEPPVGGSCMRVQEGTNVVAPKFMSEHEMKKHSEEIYKTLPEVVQKREEIKKERIKKTNLLMANMFKKNLQKKALRGNVNISNYSPVIKI